MQMLCACSPFAASFGDAKSAYVHAALPYACMRLHPFSTDLGKKLQGCDCMHAYGKAACTCTDFVFCTCSVNTVDTYLIIHA